MLKVILKSILLSNVILIVTCSNPSTWEINSDLLYPEEGVLMDNNTSVNDSSDVLLWYFEWVGYREIDEYHLIVKYPDAELPFTDIKTVDRWHTTLSFRYYIGEESLKGWKWKLRAKTQGVWSTWSEERSFDIEPPDSDTSDAGIKQLFKEFKKEIDDTLNISWGLSRGVCLINEGE